MASRSRQSARRRVWLALLGALVVVQLALALYLLDRIDGGLAWAAVLLTVVPLVIASLTLLSLRRQSVRVQELASSARRFASGEMRHRVALPDDPEFATLASALNDMAGELNRRIQQLRVQRTEQNAILQSMEVGLVALDAEHRILRVNRIARRLFNVSDDEDLRGEPIATLTDNQDLLNMVADAVADPTPRIEETELRGPAAVPGSQGDRLNVRVTLGPLLDLDDEPVGVIVLLTDITRVRRLESVRTDFAANVSHELRTPITNIKGYVETMLEMGLEDQTTARSFLEVVARNADRLGAIVDDMLVLTNLERTGQKDLALAPTSPETLLESVRQHAANDAAAKVMAVEVACETQRRVLVNSRLAEQAMFNYVLNAVKYSHVGSRVVLRAEEAQLAGQAAVRFSVEDDGPGIAPGELTRVFERFYRVDKARSRKEGGTGLGLSIVKHIARVHGGDVGVGSVVGSVVGEGSTFWITLPAAATESREGAGEGPEEGLGASEARAGASSSDLNTR